MKNDNTPSPVGKKLVDAVANPHSTSQESFAKALEITKAYASSGAATHYSAVARLLFETGRDPREK